MKVVFLAPSYPPEMQQYTRGLAEVGATVYGVGDQPASSLPASLKRYLGDYLQVPRLLDEEDLVQRVHAWVRGRQIDRVLANWEVLVLAAAKLRDRLGLPGMSADTVRVPAVPESVTEISLPDGARRDRSMASSVPTAVRGSRARIAPSCAGVYVAVCHA